jgi:hypothetical protein
LGFRVKLGDEDLGVLDEKKFSLSDSILIKNATGGQTGLTISGFFKGVQDMDPHALQALIWFLRFKKGEQVHITAIDFVLDELDMEEEPDPTQARTGNDDAVTSEPSQN